jgi:hypothetical protein
MVRGWNLKGLVWAGKGVGLEVDRRQHVCWIFKQAPSFRNEIGGAAYLCYTLTWVPRRCTHCGPKHDAGGRFFYLASGYLSFMSVGCDYVSELQPPTGLLFIPRWYMSMESHGGMILTGEKWRTRRKTCPSTTLSTTNPTWTDPGGNPGLYCERLATSHLSYGTALEVSYISRKLRYNAGINVTYLFVYRLWNLVSWNYT